MAEKRIKVIQGKYRQVGEIVIRWILEPTSRPQTVAQLRQQLDGYATVDESLTDVQFVDTPLDVAVFRLPPKEMVEASLARVQSNNFDRSQYRLPSFYGITADNLNLEPLDLFRCRVGDYSTSQCE